MSVEIPTTQWTYVGESKNTKYYEIERAILAAVPHEGGIDDLVCARENAAFQNAWLEKSGGGVVLVFFDRLVSQTKDARRIYQQEIDPRFMRATLLVGGSLLSRAMGSFFLGLSKPRTPLEMFGTTSDAIARARVLRDAHRTKEPSA